MEKENNSNNNEIVPKLSGNDEGQEKVFQPEKKKRPIALLMGVILLAAILVFMAYLYFEKKNEVERAASQKAQLMEEFMDLKDQYSLLKTDNDTMSAKLDEKEHEINELIKKLNRSKSNNAAIIRQYKKELGTLRDVLKSYIVQVDSLNTKNKELMAENLKFKTEIALTKDKNKELEVLKQELSTKVEKASVLMADNIFVEGINSRGRTVKKSKKIKKLRTCFTVRANATAETGYKMMYLRIIRPDGVLLAFSEQDMFEVGEEKLLYTEKREIEYTNQDVEVCIYRDSKGDLIKGEYKIEVYADQNLIGTGTYFLKR